MPHYAIVIDDPEKHHAAEIERNVRANLAHHATPRPKMGPQEAARLTAAVTRAVTDRTGGPRQVGDLHTVAEADCPDGGTNCRSCGDPAHIEACRAAGHCPLCGTAHGIAPDSYLAASGVSLLAVDPPGDDHAWDRETRSFRARR